MNIGNILFIDSPAKQASKQNPIAELKLENQLDLFSIHVPNLDMVNAGKISWVKLIFDYVKCQCVSKNQNSAKATQS